MRGIVSAAALCAMVSMGLSAAEPQAETTANVQPTAVQILRQAVDQFRGETSTGEMTLTIKRADWERSMTMRAWTEGDDNTLVRVIEPRRDAGNGTLSVDNNMWSYTPKINRVIKIPSSMMNQNWMGSDFSNKDISRDTDIIDQYQHRLVEVREQDGHKVYVIESIPHEEAAVVWGREVWVIRDDWIVLEQQFWDQDNVLVKAMQALEVEEMSGRMVATRNRMSKPDKPEEWTEMQISSMQFGTEIPPNMFTLSSLRNPRQ